LQGLVYHANGNYDEAINAFQSARDYFVGHEDKYNLASATHYLGRVQSAIGIRNRDRRSYDEGINNLEKSSELCQLNSFVLICYSSHNDEGKFALRWARLWKRGSSEWTSNLDRALNHFRLCDDFVSPREE